MRKLLGRTIIGTLAVALIASTAAPFAAADGQCVEAYLEVGSANVLVEAKQAGVQLSGKDVLFTIPTGIPADRDGMYIVQGTVECAGSELGNLIDCVRSAISPEQLQGCI